MQNLPMRIKNLPQKELHVVTCQNLATKVKEYLIFQPLIVFNPSLIAAETVLI